VHAEASRTGPYVYLQVARPPDITCRRRLAEAGPPPAWRSPGSYAGLLQQISQINLELLFAARSWN